MIYGNNTSRDLKNRDHTKEKRTEYRPRLQRTLKGAQPHQRYTRPTTVHPRRTPQRPRAVQSMPQVPKLITPISQPLNSLLCIPKRSIKRKFGPTESSRRPMMKSCDNDNPPGATRAQPQRPATPDSTSSVLSLTP